MDALKIGKLYQYGFVSKFFLEPNQHGIGWQRLERNTHFVVLELTSGVVKKPLLKVLLPDARVGYLIFYSEYLEKVNMD